MAFLARVHLNTPLDFSRYEVPEHLKATQLAYRVYAANFNGGLTSRKNIFDARGRYRPALYRDAHDHLTWFHPLEGTPFVSLFTDWRAALRRAVWLGSCGATKIWIYIVKVDKTCPLRARGIAEDLGLANLHYYTYEYLLRGRVSVESYDVLAVLNGIGGTTTAGSLSLPKAAVGEAGGLTWPQVQAWLDDEVYSCTGVRNPPLVTRIMGAMR